jgi:hypothetical protein
LRVEELLALVAVLEVNVVAADEDADARLALAARVR